MEENKKRIKEELEAIHGMVMETSEMSSKYEVLGFMAPYVVVKDKKTGEKGTLEFTHMPRFYYGYVAS